jgi:hypothetical protein
VLAACPHPDRRDGRSRVRRLRDQFVSGQESAAGWVFMIPDVTISRPFADARLISRLLAVFETVNAREGWAVTGCFEKFLSRLTGPVGPYEVAYVLLHGV